MNGVIFPWENDYKYLPSTFNKAPFSIFKVYLLVSLVPSCGDFTMWQSSLPSHIPFRRLAKHKQALFQHNICFSSNVINGKS